MSPVAIITALAPVLSEALGLVGDIARAWHDPLVVLPRLRALLPSVLGAAESGAMPETDAEWHERLRRRFGPPDGGTP